VKRRTKWIKNNAKNYFEPETH